MQGLAPGDRRQDMGCETWAGTRAGREREAPAISCAGRGVAPLWRCTAGLGQKIAKTTPCKVEWPRLAALVLQSSWPGLTRPSTSSPASKRDVDARDKRGHDG